MENDAYFTTIKLIIFGYEAKIVENYLFIPVVVRLLLLISPYSTAVLYAYTTVWLSIV